MSKTDVRGQDDFVFYRIGTIRSAAEFRFEAPRQAAFAEATARLEWCDPARMALCTEDLTGFDYIWLVWVFDRNLAREWHAKVRVPVPADKDRYSVFATRSPYRPNPIGISAVRLRSVQAWGLELGPCDLLDGTAVLDVKPYIPDVDAFPDARAGWRDQAERLRNEITWEDAALKRARFLLAHGGIDLENFAEVQLAFAPTDPTRKRVEPCRNDLWSIGCRTWRLIFAWSPDAHRVRVVNVISNYKTFELTESAPDPYGDKALHRIFKQEFQDNRIENQED